jgi:hypothetical protein
MSVAAIGRAKKKTTAKALPKTLLVKSGDTKKRFVKVGCARLKSDANKRAEKLKEQGFTVRVKKDPVTGTTCVFKGAKKKTASKTTKKKA